MNSPTGSHYPRLSAHVLAHSRRPQTFACIAVATVVAIAGARRAALGVGVHHKRHDASLLATRVFAETLSFSLGLMSATSGKDVHVTQL
jgi:hypothetical protein